ncbi:MAG: diguanylate cyclase (GGDEF)-like protein/PAS domain S-box-containing protein [Desulforhopalus sp.]|jgi:diguanylate cyclase (GGDEF)-like protein/PAS domain S-box-containing protein
MKMNVLSSSVLEVLPKASIKEKLRKFIVFFPIGFFIVFGPLYIVAQLEYQRMTAVKAKEHLGNMELLQFVIRHDLEALASDLLLLANNESLERYFEDSSVENLESLSERFKNFTRDKKIYSQVRYVDLKGHEVVRINMNGIRAEIVKSEDLQDKSKRYYIQKTIEQNWGEVFVSPLDLNVEKGEVARPYFPVMRVGSPVVDKYGDKKGVVLLNFGAETILDRYSQAFPEQDVTHFSFLNKNGYWLRSGNPEDEWGFMFGNEVTLKLRKPKLWAEVEKGEGGQVRMDDGLYTYITIHAEDEIKKNMIFSDPNFHGINHSHENDKVIWHLVLHVPKDELSFIFFLKNYSHLFWLFPLLLCASIAGTLHLAIIRANKDINDRTLKLLSTGLEQSPAAVVITAIDGSIQYVNPKFMQMSGYDCDFVLGENPRIFKSGTTTADTYKDLWQTVLQGKVWTGTFENKKDNHESYFVSASISPIFNRIGDITGFIAIQEDITEKKRLQEELEKLATTDALTGVFNRSHFMNRFTQEMTRSIRYDQALTVLAFDLDFFKKINDTYGHHGGDMALQAFTDVVRKELRKSDFFGRMGGEEFCAVLVQTGKDGALLLAERLRLAVELMRVPCDGELIKVTTSIGVAQWSGTDMQTEDLLKRADRALYAAKGAGRNQVKHL